MSDLQIVDASDQDRDAVMRVERDAFGRDDEPHLVDLLLRDPSARPTCSLLALDAARPVGHVLFTRATVRGAVRAVSAAIMAPLAVIPTFQRRGVGRALIEDGAARLAAAGVELVFVLGDPGYYARCGFEPALPQGLAAPYPIVPEAAWRVRALAPGVLGTIRGTVGCAAALDAPEYWRE